MKTNIRKLSVTAVLSAVSTVLLLLGKIPVTMFMPSFIKLDFSDLPALLGSFALGPVCGVIISFIKNLINLPFDPTGIPGAMSNFFISSLFVCIAGLVYSKHKNRKGALFGSILGAFASTVLSLFTNYFVTYPLYTNIMPMDTIISAYNTLNSNIDTLLEALIYFNMPFTFIKCMCNVLISFVIYKKISPILKG